MDKFESTINQIRDILRKEGITGMDSIKHCLLFMFMKFLTSEKCEQLKIDLIYSFEKISGLTDANEMKERVFVKSKMCLVNLLKKENIFSVDFKLQSNANLKTIICKIASIDISQLSLKTDIVGIIYELHLKSGTSQAMRDLGQYFTNREVIEWMVKLTNPKITNKKTGEIEKILDPSMGTGGFLTMAIKHLNETNKKINWATNKNNIYGFDIDENVAQMSLLNAFIETGLLFDKTIIKHDSLRKDYILEDGTFIDKVDVILANEPFGLKNITHAECCDRIKELKIRGTKGEPLFLQLMMLSLNEGGRCAVVVPDGVLFNESNLHTETRKYLVENLNLKKVTSLNGDFFLNTGVKSSVLYFVNDGKTNQVEFSELVIDEGKLKENFVCNVDYKEVVANGYSLFVNKYNTVEEKKLDGIKYMKLGDICEFISSKLNSGDMDSNGEYNFYSGIANNPAGKHSDYNFNINEYIGIIKGGGAGKGKYGDQIGLGKAFYLKGKNAISNGMYILKPKEVNLNIKYIYYYLLFSKNKIMDLATYTTGLGNIKQETLKQFQIPIPSMDKQKEIIETLDLFYEQLKRNTQSIKAYERIKKSIVWANTVNCTNMKKLGEICKNIKTGKNKPNDNKTGTKYPYYGTGGITGYTDEFLVDGKYILTARNGTIGQTIFVDGKSYPSDHMFILNNSSEKIEYIFYYLQNISNLVQFAVGTTIKGISKESLTNYKIPIPSKTVQESIIKECEYWDEQIDRLKKENEKLKAVPVIELCLASESAESADLSNKIQIEEIAKSDEEVIKEQFDSESDNEEPVEIIYKGKTYIKQGFNVYIKTKKGKGELYGTWNASTGKIKKIEPKEIEV